MFDIAYHQWTIFSLIKRHAHFAHCPIITIHGSTRWFEGVVGRIVGLAAKRFPGIAGKSRDNRTT